MTEKNEPVNIKEVRNYYYFSLCIFTIVILTASLIATQSGLSVKEGFNFFPFAVHLYLLTKFSKKYGVNWQEIIDIQFALILSFYFALYSYLFMLVAGGNFESFNYFVVIGHWLYFAFACMTASFQRKIRNRKKNTHIK